MKALCWWLAQRYNHIGDKAKLGVSRHAGWGSLHWCLGLSQCDYTDVTWVLAD